MISQLPFTPFMAIWIHDVAKFAQGVSPKHGFHILDDLLALIVISWFSVVEAQFALQFIRQSKSKSTEEGPKASRIFRIVCTGLAVTYTILTAVSIANVALKLELVTRHIGGEVPWLDPRECDPGYTDYSSYCVAKDRLGVFRLTAILDLVTVIFIDGGVVLADSLLIYRCLVVTAPRHRRGFAGIAACPLLASLGVMIWFAIAIQPRDIASLYSADVALQMSAYTSLVTNLIASTTLIIRLWKAKRATKDLAGGYGVHRAQIPYNRVMAVIGESALPPLLLGVLHVILHFAFGMAFVVLGVLWISLTMRLRQCVATWSQMFGRSWRPR